MKFQSFLTQKEKHDFLMDNVVINVYATIDAQSNIDKLGKHKFRLSDKGKRITTNNTTLYFTKLGRNILVSKILSFNCNSFLRRHLMDLFDVSRIESTDEFHTNVIPPDLRLKAKEHSVSIAMLRTTACNQLYGQIENTKELLRAELKENFNIDAEIVETSIRSIEVNLDIITPPNEHLNRNEHVKASLNNIVDEVSCGHYISDEGECSLLMNSVEYEKSDKGKDKLVGYLLDGSKLKIYLKGTYRTASVNRVELTFYKDQIKLHAGSTVFRTKQELMGIITTLGHVAFDGVYPALSKPSNYCDANKLEIAKQLIKTHYNHLWEEACEALLSGTCSIHTGYKGKSPSRLAQKTLSIYRDAPGTLLKKKNKGVYVLNWVWILAKK